MNIDKRKFNDIDCDLKCPYHKYIGHDISYCEYYEKNLERDSFNEEDIPFRHKLCLENVNPNINEEILRVLLMINDKLDILIDK
jgi:hypothetical protein